jgi:hypothetical protein
MDFASACSDFVRWARGGDRPVIPFDRSDRIKAQERASNTACEVVSRVSWCIDMDLPNSWRNSQPKCLLFSQTSKAMVSAFMRLSEVLLEST